MTSFQHAKEATIGNIQLPMDLINIVKSFVFYDIKTATIIKKVKECKKNTMKTITDATFSNYKKTLQQELLEYDEANMIFSDGTWSFVYINHPTESHQIQSENCTKCGDYVSEMYPLCIKCNCTVVENHNDFINQYEFFA